MSNEGIQQVQGTRVSVELDWDAPEPGVLVHAVQTTVRCDDAGRYLDAWQHAASYGARYALEVVNTLPCVVHVLEGAAAPRHINATVVAAATAQAVWSALECKPDRDIEEHVERVVAASAQCPPDVLCPFRLR